MEGCIGTQMADCFAIQESNLEMKHVQSVGGLAREMKQSWL